MARLSKHLRALVAADRKVLVAYIVAGDPTLETTVPLMHKLVEAGVDVMEVGVPFSDPEAEGPVIQLAHERALARGTSLHDCFAMTSAFRKRDQETPLVLMGYLNPVETLGYEAFAAQAADAGIDGTILVNLPPEEATDMDAALKARDIEPVYLLAPTTTDERAEKICKASRGFVYYVSLKGTTGASSLDVDDVAQKMKRFRKISSLPVLVGFGVQDGKSAKAVAAVADGVVVGSAIVRLMEQHQEDSAKLQLAVSQFVSELRAAID